MKLSPSGIPFVTVPGLLLAGLLSAQVPGERLAATMAENARLLHQYTFKQRTEAKYKGEDKIVRTSQVRFDPDGKRQTTLISQTGGEEATGLGHRIIQKKRDEMKEYVERLSALVENYLPPDPDKFREALAKAEIGQAGNQMALTMKNYVKAGDSLVIVADPVTRKLVRLELKTTLDKDPISVTADMAFVPNGPSYPGVTKVKAPSKNLEIDISQYDFMKL